MPIIGYKPQIIRSKQGFITALRVPKENNSDSNEFPPTVIPSVMNTKVFPHTVSTDNGYVFKLARSPGDLKVRIVGESGSGLG